MCGRDAAVGAPQRPGVDAVERRQRRDVDELHHGGDDHGGERGLGEVLEQAA
jgi:hypothetical protein